MAMRLPTHAVVRGPNRSRQRPITKREIRRLEMPAVAILSSAGDEASRTSHHSVIMIVERDV